MYSILFLFPFSVIFAPTELKVRVRVSTLNVTWHPSPNHTLVSGYKLSYREVEPEESANGERTTQTHTIRLRKKARYHLLTGLGKLGQVKVFKVLKHGMKVVISGYRNIRLTAISLTSNSLFVRCCLGSLVTSKVKFAIILSPWMLHLIWNGRKFFRVKFLETFPTYYYHGLFKLTRQQHVQKVKGYEYFPKPLCSIYKCFLIVS